MLLVGYPKGVYLNATNLETNFSVLNSPELVVTNFSDSQVLCQTFPPAQMFLQVPFSVILPCSLNSLRLVPVKISSLIRCMLSIV